jgi:DMSO/TMAO reductase YedYZ molybdopterin-dependent catalytic subunit
MRSLTRLACILALLLAMPIFSADADEAALTIDGFVKQSLHLTRAALTASPATELDVSFGTGHGDERAHYAGVSLWRLIEEAGLPDEPGNNKHHLSHVAEVTGADGYTVAVAIGEMDPEFEGKSVILAYTKDGQKIPGTGLRLVVPGDQRGGRSVHDVVRVEIR